MKESIEMMAPDTPGFILNVWNAQVQDLKNVRAGVPGQ